VRVALVPERLGRDRRAGPLRVLALDDMLTALGRRPFTGNRSVWGATGNAHLHTPGRGAARPDADRTA